VGTLPDKVLVGLTRLRAADAPDDAILSAPETSCPISVARDVTAATGPRNGKLERLAGERLVGEKGGGGEVDAGGEDVEEEQGLERPQPGAATRGIWLLGLGRSTTHRVLLLASAN
jgi:hypothetical protein